MKIYKLLLVILLVCLVSGCTKEKTESEIQNHIEEPKQEENTDNQTIQESFDEYSVLITAKAINIRSNPDATNKENISGQVYMGETYTVFEENKDNDYTWYRIGENKWIANDGTWCIEFDKGENKDYPYVMNDEEVSELLSVIGVGSSCYTTDQKGIYLNIYGDSDDKAYPLKRTILIGIVDAEITDSYTFRYNIGKIARINDVTYDVYVTPELFNGGQDNSLGCIRIYNIGIYIGDGGYSEHPYCDVIYIQNNNDTTNEKMQNLFGVEMHFFCSHQVHI